MYVVSRWGSVGHGLIFSSDAASVCMLSNSFVLKCESLLPNKQKRVITEQKKQQNSERIFRQWKDMKTPESSQTSGMLTGERLSAVAYRPCSVHIKRLCFGPDIWYSICHASTTLEYWLLLQIPPLSHQCGLQSEGEILCERRFKIRFGDRCRSCKAQSL